MACPDCKTVLKVGFAVSENIKQHKEKGGCDKALAEAKKKKPIHAKLSNFFFKQTPSNPLVPATTSAPGPSQSTVTETELMPTGTGPEVLEDPIHPETFATFLGAKPCPEAQELMRAEYDWNGILLPPLKRAFGEGELDLALSSHYISLGNHGLDGFCDFFNYFISTRRLLGHCIKPYFEFLCAGIEKRFPTAKDSVAPRMNPKEVYDELHRALHVADQEFAPESDKTQACCGLAIRFPEGTSHHVAYPSGLHQQYDLPWDNYSRRNEFFIQSHDCRRSLVSATQACLSCEALLPHDVLVGILHRIARGTHPSTPIIYRPTGVLVDTVRNKSEECRGLKLTNLALHSELR
ncbi:hypothetical protein R3P38DRAFT_2775653 [Favolaschia claudopus]|uniref:Uncharacterized protein n=1 Tax=Favolaschia claudopus TaxID=2862362 RepID=A0AAW0BR01_9AGAR